MYHILCRHTQSATSICTMVCRLPPKLRYFWECIRNLDSLHKTIFQFSTRKSLRWIKGHLRTQEDDGTRNLNLVVPAPWAKHWGFKLEKHVNEMVGWVMEIKLIATHSLGGWDDFHQTWAALMDKNLCDVVGMWFLHWNVNQKRSVTRNPRVKSSRNHALPVVNVNLSPGFWTTKPDDETSIHKSGNYYRFLSVARRMLDMGLDPWLQWAGVFCWTCI